MVLERGVGPILSNTRKIKSDFLMSLFVMCIIVIYENFLTFQIMIFFVNFVAVNNDELIIRMTLVTYSQVGVRSPSQKVSK